MFFISMLFIQVFIGKFSYYDDSDYDYIDDDYYQTDYFVYIFTFINLMTCNMFLGMEM